MRAYILIHHNGWYKNVFFFFPFHGRNVREKKRRIWTSIFCFLSTYLEFASHSPHPPTKTTHVIGISHCTIRQAGMFE